MANQVPIKLVCFDFDQTISRCHVCMQLAGGGKQNQFVKPPFALSERGQIWKISELNAAGSFRWDDAPAVVTETAACTSEKGAEAEGGERWTTAALGGRRRVEELRLLFSDLRAQGATLVIITKGYTGAVRKLMAEEDLLDHFDMVYGNTGKAYGEAEFDKLPHPSSPFEGSPESGGWSSKAEVVSDRMRASGLSGKQCVLVEDDPAEVLQVRSLCRSLLVKARKGMTAAHMARLRLLANCPSGICAEAVNDAVKRPSLDEEASESCHNSQLKRPKGGRGAQLVA